MGERWQREGILDEDKTGQWSVRLDDGRSIPLTSLVSGLWHERVRITVEVLELPDDANSGAAEKEE